MATRVLGSPADAEDAVQEAWLRAGAADRSEVRNTEAWLTTIVSRVCLNTLRSRAPLDADEPPDRPDDADGPEAQAVRTDVVGQALDVVLDALAPAERVAFVLHDLFGVPFDDIATVLDRTPAATRQLASRGRRRARAADPEPNPDLARRREVVAAFFAASREGDLSRLLSVLDPDVVVRPDAAALEMGSPAMAGADTVARFFDGGAAAARQMLIDGTPGAVWSHRGKVMVAFEFTVREGRVVAIDLHGDPALLDALDLDRH